MRIWKVIQKHYKRDHFAQTSKKLFAQGCKTGGERGEGALKQTRSKLSGFLKSSQKLYDKRSRHAERYKKRSRKDHKYVST
ncbi:MAG: hypothetical protein PWQ66_392 [Petrotoga sp.]|nr:hypothetical protein [Petrotoga sp.]